MSEILKTRFGNGWPTAGTYGRIANLAHCARTPTCLYLPFFIFWWGGGDLFNLFRASGCSTMTKQAVRFSSHAIRRRWPGHGGRIQGRRGARAWSQSMTWLMVSCRGLVKLAGEMASFRVQDSGAQEKGVASGRSGGLQETTTTLLRGLTINTGHIHKMYEKWLGAD